MPTITERCVGCGECAAFCPVRAIKVCGRAKIGRMCNGCGICVRMCPIGAIVEEG